MKYTLEELETLVVKWFYKEYGKKQCWHHDEYFVITISGNKLTKSLVIMDQIGDACDTRLYEDTWSDLFKKLENKMNLEN